MKSHLLTKKNLTCNKKIPGQKGAHAQAVEADVDHPGRVSWSIRNRRHFSLQKDYLI